VGTEDDKATDSVVYHDKASGGESDMNGGEDSTEAVLFVLL